MQDISHQYLLHLLSVNLGISYNQDIQLFISVLLYSNAEKKFDYIRWKKILECSLILHSFYLL